MTERENTIKLITELLSNCEDIELLYLILSLLSPDC